MLVSSRIQKRICIFNKISLFQWPETTHSAFEKTIFFSKNFFEIFKKKFFFKSRQIRLKKAILKIPKKKFFFWSHIFCENRHEIAKNRPVDKIKTVPNRQDFELSRTHWFFAFETILLQYISKKPQIIQENFEFLKNGSFWAFFSISDWLYTH